MFAMKKLVACGYPYVAIDHDSCVYTSLDTDDITKIGTLKKKHTHIIIQFNNPRSLDAVSKELGIDSNYLQVCRDTKASMLYLIHYGRDDKYQYEVDSCYGPLKSQLLKYLSGDTEGVRVLCLLDLLDQMPVPCSYRKFLVACCQNDLYSEFRRLGLGITKLLEEHNGVGFSTVV